jgi:D-alanyl-D-alanine carboxypeptidase (penicillin-binding protein 5/6)
MKKLLIILVVLLIFTSCEASIPDNWDATFDLDPFPYEDELYSRSVYVADMETGAVGLAVNEQSMMMGASTIKIMTALVVLEELGEGELLDTLVKVPIEIYEGFNTEDPNTVGSSLSGIALNQDNLTYRDCLYALMMRSGNEAANILAWNLTGGDYEMFSYMMNAKAAELGTVNTNFSNAHGLHEVENWSCARDLAVIAKYAYEKYPLFRKLCIEAEYVMPGNYVFTRGYRIQNGNALVRRKKGNIYYRDFVKGVKNGALDEVWNYKNGEWEWSPGIANLVSIGEKDGKSYVVVTLEAPFKRGALREGESLFHYAHDDHLRIYDWLFGESEIVEIEGTEEEE